MRTRALRRTDLPVRHDGRKGLGLAGGEDVGRFALRVEAPARALPGQHLDEGGERRVGRLAGACSRRAVRRRWCAGCGRVRVRRAPTGRLRPHRRARCRRDSRVPTDPRRSRRSDRRGSGRRCRDTRSRSRTRRCHGPDRPSCPTRRRSRCGGGRSSRRPRRTRSAPRRPSSAAQAARRTTTGPGRAATAAAAFRPGARAGSALPAARHPATTRPAPAASPPPSERPAAEHGASGCGPRPSLLRRRLSARATPLSRSEGIGAPAPHSGGARMCTSGTLRADRAGNAGPRSHPARYVAVGEKILRLTRRLRSESAR